MKGRIIKLLEQHKNDRITLPALKFVPKKQVLKDANTAVSNINTSSLQETNQPIYRMAAVITEYLGCKINKYGKRPNSALPKWEIRLENKIVLRSDSSKLSERKEQED